jgi:hypothetical protein
MSQLQQSTRKEVFEQKGNECVFCEVTRKEHEEKYGRDLDVHHVIPKRKGGSDEASNLIPVCIGCHKTLESTQGKALGRIAEDEMDARKMAEIERQNNRLKDRVDELKGEVNDLDRQISDILNGVDQILRLTVSDTVYAVHRSKFVTSELKYIGGDMEKAQEKFKSAENRVTMETAKVNIRGWAATLTDSDIEMIQNESQILADAVKDEIEHQNSVTEDDPDE